MQIRKTQQSVRSAFTLTEMLVVVAIIVVLAGIGGDILLPQLEAAKDKAAKVQAKKIASVCDQYAMDHNDEYPNNLEILCQPDDQFGNSPRMDLKEIRDPWNNEYQIDHDQYQKIVIFTINKKGVRLSSKD